MTVESEGCDHNVAELLATYMYIFYASSQQGTIEKQMLSKLWQDLCIASQ